MIKKNYGATNRRKGHNAERSTAQEFRDIGYTFCKTSRQASRLLDDAKVDLAFIPYNIQIKAGKQKGFNAIKELKEMEEAIKELFPPEDAIHTNPNIVLLRKEVGPGNKRTIYDDVITMAFEDFKQLIKKKK
jgi:hypothetical protein